MISTNSRNDTEAIYFFDDGHILKEMLYVEFEAVLNGVVGIPECRNKQFNTVYVNIESGLRLQAAVLFKTRFDDDGHVVKTWNLPLRYLASQADIGPDLGEGAIKVMMASSCHDPEYQSHLWDCGKGLVEVLTSIKRSIKRNKLGLYSRAPAPISGHGVPGLMMQSFQGQLPMPGLAPWYPVPQSFAAPNYMQANLESALRDQREQVRSELEASHANSLHQLEELNATLKLENEALIRQRQSLEAEARKQIDLIVDKYKAKLRSQLAEQECFWQDKVAEKELLLHYAEEKQNQLREEMVQLRRTIEAEKDRAVEELLQEVATSGMELIVTEQGLGSFAVKPRYLFDYLENPSAFMALQNGVSEAIYTAWRGHYNNPVCQAGSSTGCGCAVPVQRVDHPRDFILGESDVCRTHRMKRIGEYD